MKIINIEDNSSIIKRTQEFCNERGLDDSKVELKITGAKYSFVTYAIDNDRTLRFQGNREDEFSLYGFSLLDSNNQEFNLYIKNGIEPTKENINAVLDKEIFDILTFLSPSGLDFHNIVCQKDKLEKVASLYKEILKITNND